MGRKPIGKKAMTDAQRQRRRRQRIKHSGKIEQRAQRERAMAEATRLASAGLVKMALLYGVLYADPPYRFEPRSRISGMDRSADNHYGTMTVEEIAALKVPAAKNCVLFLWATAPMMPAALKIMEAWGFIYRTQIVWVKDRIGTGYWFRNKHEILLIGTRGNVPAPAPGTQFPSVIEAPVGAHSEKPEAIAEMIEAMFPNVPKLEMFARRPRAGWDIWGNEVGEVLGSR
jgi:N6-adenosine-specific RNA methylase IME4